MRHHKHITLLTRGHLPRHDERSVTHLVNVVHVKSSDNSLNPVERGTVPLHHEGYVDGLSIDCSRNGHHWSVHMERNVNHLVRLASRGA